VCPTSPMHLSPFFWLMRNSYVLIAACVYLQFQLPAFHHAIAACALHHHLYTYLLAHIHPCPTPSPRLYTLCSTVDDPMLFSAMLPASFFFTEHRHKLTRWSLCAKEICYSNTLLGWVLVGRGATGCFFWLSF
jgi:hypothetical protein